MTSLTEQQKEVIFDYCMGIATAEQATQAKELIFSNAQAADIHAKLKAGLSPLDSIEPQRCPDELAEGTIWRLTNLARTSQLHLEQLLAAEQTKSTTAKSEFWRNLGQLAAAAAIIIFVAGVLLGPLSFARQQYWKQVCQMQLKRIWQGLNNYTADHDGQLPSVATTAGSPWWKVGYQGKENHSNTRHIWLLAKGDYVNPTDFICPAKSQGKVTQFDPAKAKDFNDFPARRYVTYSFKIRCNKSTAQRLQGPQVLIADLNPLFERLPVDYSRPFKLQLTNGLLKLNSSNHNRKGQNVLFYDGGVKFVEKRGIGILNDDIFTLRGRKIYEGTEVPTCETDAFLAP